MAYLKGKKWMAKIPDPECPGKYVYIPLGKKSELTKRQAFDMETDVRRELIRQAEEFFDISKYGTMTVAGLLEYFLENHSKVNRKPDVAKGDEYFIRKLNKVLGEINIHQLRPEQIYHYMATRRTDVSFRSRQEKGVSELTISTELRLLKFAYKLARENWEITKKDPFKKVRLPKENKKRVRFMLPEEEKAIIAMIEQRLEKKPGFIWFPRVLSVARLTAIRATNLCEITMKHVDIFNKGFYLPNCKNNEPNLIPWSSACEGIVLDILKERGDLKPNDRLFVDDRRCNINRHRVSRTQLQICRDAGVEDYRWHDNRHDAISKMVQGGSNLYQAGQVAGHKDQASTQRYAHLEQKQKREAVNKITILQPAPNRKKANG